MQKTEEGGVAFVLFFFLFLFFKSPRKKRLRSGSEMAGNSLLLPLLSAAQHLFTSLSGSLCLPLFSSLLVAFVLADNKPGGAGRKKRSCSGQEFCLNQKCQLKHAELSSLSSHNLLPGCFHFIGSAHTTHSSTIPPPLFPSSSPFLCFISDLDSAVF